jgi:hypothetical protein
MKQLYICNLKIGICVPVHTCKDSNIKSVGLNKYLTLPRDLHIFILFYYRYTVYADEHAVLIFLKERVGSFRM